MQITQAPVAHTAMLIRRPVAEVFEAFVNPDIITKFWFTKSSGRLAAGEEVVWEWEMYDASAPVTVKVVDENARIVIEWQGNHGPTMVEWVFVPRADGTTFVEITNAGFGGDGDQVVQEALDSMGGFTWVLAGAKAWLEHKIQLNLTADRYPPGVD